MCTCIGFSLKFEGKCAWICQTWSIGTSTTLFGFLIYVYCKHTHTHSILHDYPECFHREKARPMLENFTKLNVGKKNQLVNEKTKRNLLWTISRFRFFFSAKQTQNINLSGCCLVFFVLKRNRRVDTLVLYCTAVFRQEIPMNPQGGLLMGMIGMIYSTCILENYVFFKQQV